MDGFPMKMTTYMKFYKEKMGMTIDGNQTIVDTMQKTNTGELIGEVGIIAKRIEYLEEQAENRNKQSQADFEPYKREIARLNEELQHERARFQNLIGKKNAEISYFKSELDGLLSEMMNSTQVSQSSPQKSNLPANDSPPKREAF